MKWNNETVKVELKANSNKNPTWFRKNRAGLVDWCDRNGGWIKWQKDFNIINVNRWDEQRAMKELEKHKDKNYSWFKNNMSGLLFWLNTHGGWIKWAKASGIGVVKTVWTEKKVLEIFNEFKSQPMQWFYENHNGMMQWCIKNGGIKYWKDKVGRESRREFTDESVSEFFESHKTKTASWFRSNDPSLSHWCEKNGTWDEWTKKFGIMEKDKWDEKKAVAFMKKNANQSFNWFKLHHPSLVRWCSVNGGWRIWANNAGVQTCSALRTKESVIAYLKQNRDKDLMWFIKNDTSLVRWCYRQEGGLTMFAEKAGIKTAKGN